MRSISSPRRCLSRPGGRGRPGQHALEGAGCRARWRPSRHRRPCRWWIAFWRCLEVRPASVGGYPEDVLGLVPSGSSGLAPGVVALLVTDPATSLARRSKVSEMYLRKIRPRTTMPHSARVHVVAQLVGGEPELGFEAEIGGGVGFLFGVSPSDCLWGDDGARYSGHDVFGILAEPQRAQCGWATVNPAW